MSSDSENLSEMIAKFKKILDIEEQHNRRRILNDGFLMHKNTWMSWKQEVWIDLICLVRDDYLYIIDLNNDTLGISQSAVERFMLSDKFPLNDATKHTRTLIYEKKTISCLENHKRKIYDGKEKKVQRAMSF